MADLPNDGQAKDPMDEPYDVGYEGAWKEPKLLKPPYEGITELDAVTPW